jgi:DNA/RNA-binding domain of Phe-tRNA-synthetase-like protein
MSINITIDEGILASCPDCRIGCIEIHNIGIVGSSPTLSQEFLKLQNEVAKIYNIEGLTHLPPIMAVRSMYKRLDFDPSRYRPASESLVRRVLQHKGLYYVNSAVDASNYCSLKFLMPFGLYDLDKIAGDIVYQRAHGGYYTNMGGQQISTEGKPFLTDHTGVFGNPASDSQRTAVSLATRNVLSIVFAGSGTSTAELMEILQFTADLLTHYNKGEIKELKVVGPEGGNGL